MESILERGNHVLSDFEPKKGLEHVWGAKERKRKGQVWVEHRREVKEEGEQGLDHARALFLAVFFPLYHKGSGSRQVNYSELAVHLE